MSKLSRREFIKRSAAAGAASGAILAGFGSAESASAAEVKQESYAALIDLTKCDGCSGLEIAKCVSACREENQAKYPKPAAPEEIEYYWPNKKKEDWQGKKQVTNRLTPYNWITVQKVTVEHNGQKTDVFIPRRCMHCDNPPCANLCPFAAQYKTKEGPVLINKELCLGGAKCRTVCPWNIPQRQAGVGLYMNIAPKYLGAGVMYKCDLCYDRLLKGKVPACVEACPKGAMQFGSKSDIKKLAKTKAQKINGYIYGDKENGGTSTLYLSAVPFEKINEQLKLRKKEIDNPAAPGYPLMETDFGNFLDTVNGMFASMLIAPIAGAALAGFTAYKKLKGGERSE